MCGITGIFDPRHKRATDRSLLMRMTAALTHRGPDASGIHVEPGVGLGHRRLSIIDLEGGHQPLFNEDGSVAVVYNGEIFNFQELAEQLAASGHIFQTRCDTEVIVHAWEEWGEACVQRFRGQFAFALWDRNRQCLFLARDRLGVKPLYYAWLKDGRFIFASELGSLLHCPELAREIDPRAVEDYFSYGYVPDPKSIYTSVAKLAPAHHLTVARGEGAGRPQCYWDLAFAPRLDGSAQELGEELIERLREAAKIRLIADVPLGAFLSGGVDSSAVVALMAQGATEPVNTCSIGFNHSDYDESTYSTRVAERYGTRHNLRQADADDFDLVDRLADVYGEPFADSSAMPTFGVCGLARERVTVALSGDGGDEAFAGYRRYRWHHYEELVRQRLPQAARGPLFGVLGRMYPKLDWAPKVLRAKSTLQAVALDSADAYFHSVSTLSDAMRGRLFAPSFKRSLQGYHAGEVLRAHMRDAPTEHHLSRVQYADFKTYLPGDILTKVDRASMAHSLEVRVPILDHQFLEWASGLPHHFKLRGRQGKYLFKKSLDRLLPHNVLYRPKMGFAVPLAQWFRGPLRSRVREALAGPLLAETGIFDTRYLGTLFDQHQTGTRDHGTAIWSLVMFESFLRRVHHAPNAGGPTRIDTADMIDPAVIAHGTS